MSSYRRSWACSSRGSRACSSRICTGWTRSSRSCLGWGQLWMQSSVRLQLLFRHLLCWGTWRRRQRPSRWRLHQRTRRRSRRPTRSRALAPRLRIRARHRQVHRLIHLAWHHVRLLHRQIVARDQFHDRVARQREERRLAAHRREVLDRELDAAQEQRARVLPPVRHRVRASHRTRLRVARVSRRLHRARRLHTRPWRRPPAARGRGPGPRGTASPALI